MLLVKIWNASPARAGMAIPSTPPCPGWVVAWNPAGRIPEAVTGSNDRPYEPEHREPDEQADREREAPPTFSDAPPESCRKKKASPLVAPRGLP